MSTFCAAAAPTRHPPGDAHAAPRALSVRIRVAQVAAPSGYLGGSAARGSITTSPIEEPLSSLSPRDNTTDDAPTPTHPTTSAYWRQKRIRRHHATPSTYPPRLRQPTRGRPMHGVLDYLGGAAAGGSPQGSQPKSPRRLATTRQTTSQLQPTQQLRPAVAQNASGDTTRHTTASRPTDSTPCRPVVPPNTRRRHSNPLPCQPLRFLSPETRKATNLPARKFAREATTAAIAPLLQWATCRQFGHLFPPFKDYR